MDSKYIKIIILATASVFLISDIIVPFLSTGGKIVDLDGTFGYIDNSSLWASLDPFSSVIYTIGDFLCHQQMSRTFILNGNEMPVCVRDVGPLIGIVIGMAIMLSIKEYERKKFIIISVASLVLMFIDWLIQNIFSLNVPATRLITGILAGAAISMIIAMALDGKLTDII